MNSMSCAQASLKGIQTFDIQNHAKTNFASRFSRYAKSHRTRSRFTETKVMAEMTSDLS